MHKCHTKVISIYRIWWQYEPLLDTWNSLPAPLSTGALLLHSYFGIDWIWHVAPVCLASTPGKCFSLFLSLIPFHSPTWRSSFKRLSLPTITYHQHLDWVIFNPSLNSPWISNILSIWFISIDQLLKWLLQASASYHSRKYIIIFHARNSNFKSSDDSLGQLILMQNQVG